MVDHIQIKTGVVFKLIPQAFLPVFSVLLALANRYHFTPVLTGAAEHRKVAGDTHDSGFAWDIRTSNMHNPRQVYEELRFALLAVDARYRVLYGDEAHQDHIHIAFRFQMPPLAAKTL
jgi:hypothetical protein